MKKDKTVICLFLLALVSVCWILFGREQYLNHVIDLESARAYTSIAVLPNNKVLILGGVLKSHDSSRDATPDIELVDLATKRATAIKGLRLETTEELQIFHEPNGNLLIFSPYPYIGLDWGPPNTTGPGGVFEYDLPSRTFKKLPDPKVKNNSPLVAKLNHRELLIVGGEVFPSQISGRKYIPSYTTKAAYVFDMVSHKYSSIAPSLYEHTIGNPIATRPDGKVWILSGYGNEIYDSKIETFTKSQLVIPEDTELSPSAIMPVLEHSNLTEKQFLELLRPVKIIGSENLKTSFRSYGIIYSPILLNDGNVFYISEATLPHGIINAKFSMVINIYNPHTRTLQLVKEFISSTGMYNRLGMTATLLDNGNVALVGGINSKCGLYVFDYKKWKREKAKI